MMKFKYFFISVISFFVCFITVSAGVCDEKTTNSVGYCNLGRTYQYPDKTTTDLYKNRYFAKNGGEGYLGYPYLATGQTFSGQDEVSFCLDPAKFDPNSYSYGRELKIDFSDNIVTYDENIYKVYQYYINNLIAAGNNAEKNKSKYLAFTDVMFRIYTAAYGYDLGISEISPYYYYSILPYIIANGKDVLNNPNKIKLENEIGKEVVKNLYNNNNDDGICKKTDKKLDNFDTCGTDWASSKSLIDEEYGVKNYINTVVNGNNILWKNPLNITASVETDSNGKYVYSFEVDFKKDGYQYFGGTYDSDIGYGNAFFEFVAFEINGLKFDSNIHGNDIQSTVPLSVVNYSNNSQNDSKTYKFSIPADVYQTLNVDGKVDVKMVYKTYHPMSDENVFINYINERNSGSESLYQRMIVFTKYANEKKIGLESNFSSNCIQEGNTFKIKGTEASLEDYIKSCGCTNVDYEVLDNEKKSIYKSKCKRIKVSVESNLRSCDLDEDKGDYQITYTEVQEINEYCSLTCTENVAINSLVKKNQELSVKAGMYFKLPQYPELVSSKTCVVNMSEHTITFGPNPEDKVDIKGYQRWKQDYEAIISELTGLYNKKEYYQQAKKLPESTCCIGSCSCGEDCVTCCHKPPKYPYSTSYNSSKYTSSIAGAGKLESDETPTQTAYFHYCYSDGIAGDRTSTLNAYNDKVAELKRHLNKLNTCTRTIEHMGLANEEYYTYVKEMNFYYEQEYSNSSFGIKYNDERPYNVSDKELVFDYFYEENSDSINYSSNHRYIPKNGEFYYDGINPLSGMGTKTTTNYDSGFEEYKRVVKYTYGNSRSNVYKYVDNYTGKISSVPSSLNNPIPLGYVYDTDASAKIKIDNDNYYELSALGDENKIYNYFKNGRNVNFPDGLRSATLDDLERHCTYEITNEVVKDSKLNLVFRIVDPKNIDPNGRMLVDDKGFQNWKSHLDVKEEIEGKDTYNPDNIEYSFELDSKTIKDIREYNSSTNYSDFKLDCDADGNACKSDFVENYATKDDLGNMVGDGRGEWKGLGGE